MSLTALLTAALRANESSRADRLFDDPFAGALAGSEGRALLRSIAARLGGEDVFAPIAVRTRFIDDVVLRVVTEAHVHQVVLLAAGMDTRAYRLALPPTTRVFEVDRLALLVLKEARLRSIQREPRCHRVVIEADFVRRWPIGPLLDAGFSEREAVLWIIEGLLVYLEEAAIHRLISELTAASPPNSWLVADVVSARALRHPGTIAVQRILAGAGAPMRFGTDDPGELFARCGWDPSVVPIGTGATAYGRSHERETRSLAQGAPHTYIVTATLGRRHPASPRAARPV